MAKRYFGKSGFSRIYLLGGSRSELKTGMSGDAERILGIPFLRAKPDWNI